MHVPQPPDDATSPDVRGAGLKDRIRSAPQSEELLRCLLHTCHQLDAGQQGSEGRMSDALCREVSGYFTMGPLPLFLPRRGKESEARAALEQLAQSPLWRRELLIPLLCRWIREGAPSHPFPHKVLIPALLATLEEELRATWPAESCVSQSNNSDGNESHRENATRHKTAMTELQNVAHTTGSFRVICAGVDAIVHGRIRCLLWRLQHSSRCVLNLRTSSLNSQIRIHATTITTTHMNTNTNHSTASGATTLGSSFGLSACHVKQLLEREVGFVAESIWSDVSAHLSACGCDAAPLESVWTFIMSLLSLYSAAFAPHTSDMDPVQMLMHRLLSDFRRFVVTKGLAGSTVSSLIFWHSAASVVRAVSKLPLADRILGARTATTAWGRAVQVVLHLQQQPPLGPFEDNEEDSTMRKRSRHAMDEAMEFFLRVRAPGCFALLALERQDALATAILELHSVIMGDERRAVLMSMPTHKRWLSHEVYAPLLRALRDEGRLMMCLLHAVFILREREATTSLGANETLHNALFPTLAHLCRDNNYNNDTDNEHVNENEEDNDEDDEDYYELRCTLAMLHLCGLLDIPFERRGMRLRLLLYHTLSARAVECFSAEEALATLETITTAASNSALSSASPNTTTTTSSTNTATTNYGAVAGARRASLEEILAAAGGEHLLLLFKNDHDDNQGSNSNGDNNTSSNKSIDNNNTEEEALRALAPTNFPAPCGALLVLAVHRTLERRLRALRAEWEVQQQKYECGTDADYLGREAVYCTSHEVALFKTLIWLAHRMVFVTQLQPRGLLRLWIAHLCDIFTRTIPPQTDDDEMIFHAGARGDWRQLQRAPNESPQAELRAALGELLADLALSPLVDASAAVEKWPAAVSHRPGSERWLRQKQQRAREVAMLQRTLPVAVLEELTEALGVSATVNSNGGGLEVSFLGITGTVAFCRRLEVYIVPGTINDARVEALLRNIWAAISKAVTGSVA